MEDVHLTQTQPFIAQTQGAQLAAAQHAADVHARLISLTDPGFQFEIRASQKQVQIGRHPARDIRVDDKRASGTHLRIYRDEAFRYFVEELSANGCFINEHKMNKGDTRAVKHGDAISLCVNAHATGKEKPFAAYIFSFTNHEKDACRQPSGGGAASIDGTTTGPGGHSPLQPAATAAPGVSSVASFVGANRDTTRNNNVTEQWLRENWDTRITLGSGNFSEVRLGVHVQRGEKRAVKIIDKKKFYQFQTKRESHLCLSDEAELLTNLCHPGIVRFFEWFQTDVHLYVVMELMEGGDLLQSILEDGHFAELQARRLFLAICDAVRYMHNLNIVHRDLKPENILLTCRDREAMHPKIADFGLARKNMQSKDCRTFCGTPHYFAPEVINTFRDRETGANMGYGKKVDMWSLGVILYVLLSGIPPFEEDGLYEQILEGKYEFDVREWTTVSPEAKELIRRLMTVNPKERLTIQEAFELRWLRLASHGERRVLGGDDGGGPASKRLRSEVVASVPCLGQLGA